MFIIKCQKCGAEQRWGEGMMLGQGTVIEVADRAVFCECEAGVEEENGELKNSIDKSLN
ncbi:hypothetical protein [Ferroacidibacillus organovorans]|uniref:hypothetical protein n=1 Tax=Ferroacidibacillus organovorans TaxID=1765683 RepID=UPI0015C4736F|nr:hypothetical protein [Ferroacidibacillus organovorans]